MLLSGSAIGIYGRAGDELLDETSAPGTGFLADVCVAWEAATAPAADAGVRVAHLRSGVVLSGDGGALKKQLPLFKFGLGGKMGSGEQWQSWISIDDEVGAIVHLLSSTVSGPVNLTAPQSGDERRVHRHARHRRCTARPCCRSRSSARGCCSAPNWPRTCCSPANGSCRGCSTDDGYEFRHPDLADALQAAIA